MRIAASVLPSDETIYYQASDRARGYRGGRAYQPPAQNPKQYHSTATGVLVEANAYWNAIRQAPPSPVLKRKTFARAKPQPDLGSDAQAAAAATAQADGLTGTTRLPVGVMAPVTRNKKADLVPVTEAGNINWSANPVSHTSQLGNVNQVSPMGSVYMPVMNNSGKTSEHCAKRKRSIWLWGVKPTEELASTVND